MKRDGRIGRSLDVGASVRMAATRGLVAVCALALLPAANGDAPAGPEAVGSTGFPGARFPWPNLASDNLLRVRASGLAVRVYEVKAVGAHATGADGKPPAPVLVHEPLVRLVPADAETPAVPRTVVSADGEVTIFFWWDENPSVTREAIRRQWSPGNEAHARPRVLPIQAVEAWFESPRDGVRSNVFVNESFSTSGEMAAFFRFDSVDDARAFVRNLDHGQADKPTTLTFKYRLVGDAVDECWARYSASNIRDVERFRDLAGTGGSGFVGRQQVANVARNVIAGTHVAARCRDVSAIERIVDKAVELAGRGTPIESWVDLERFVEIAKEDFMAAVTKSWAEENTSESRTQDREASTESSASEVGAGLGVTWGDVVALLTGKLNVASAEAESKFRDVMSKHGFQGEWVGTRYEPKDLEVYRLEDLYDAWASGVEVSYQLVRERTVVNTIHLTRGHLLGTVAVEEGVKFRREIDKLGMAYVKLHEGCERQSELLRRLTARTGELENLLFPDTEPDFGAHFNANRDGDYSLFGENVGVEGRRDVSVQAKRTVTVEGGRRVFIAGDQKIRLQTRRLELPGDVRVGKERLVGLRSCTYRVSAAETGGRTQYRILANRDELAIVTPPSCTQRDAPNVSIARVGRGDSRWALWFDSWRGCRDWLDVKVLFIDGFGAGRDGTYRSPRSDDAVAKLEKEWCSDDPH